MNYYNEYDKNVSAWLRELIKRGLIAEGVVDERSIVDVEASDLRGFSQCHFFAGIGGWSYALRLAGWPDDSPVWTASLPCQPFSTAGKQLGKNDERHLLPHYLELVRQCRPATQFGEQVASAIKHGWLDDLYAEMEACDYAVGATIIGAHSVNAPHIRQRLYWVANSKGERERRASGFGYRQKGIEKSKRGQQDRELVQFIPGGAIDSRMGYNELHGCLDIQKKRSISERETKSGVRESKRSSTEWNNPEWRYCRDGKYRPIKPGIKPVVNGISVGMGHGGDSSTSTDYENTQEARVMRLKGYGNAIVPQVAAIFIKCNMETHQ